MRILLAHDYLTQFGGAERVTLAILDGMPEARLVTSAYNQRDTFPGFLDHDIEVLKFAGQRLVRADVRLGLPLLARAFSAYPVRDADVVVCSSSGWSHHIRAAVPKIVYCHNPPRWLYQSKDYLADQKIHVRAVHAVMQGGLRRRDVRAAGAATKYLANSHSVAVRLKAAYNIDAEVLHPPVHLDASGPMAPIPEIKPGYFLVVARPRGYKHTQVVIDAAESIGERLVVVGAEVRTHGPGVESLGRVSDATLRWLYRNAVATVGASYEDFGLTPLESNLFGTPVIALRAGGYLETVVEGKTGLFFGSPSKDEISLAMRQVRSMQFSLQVLREHADSFSSGDFVSRLRAIAQEFANTAHVPRTKL